MSTGTDKGVAVDEFLRQEGVARLERMRAAVDSIEHEMADVTDLLLWCTSQTQPREGAPGGAPYLVDIGLKVFVPAVPAGGNSTRLLVRCGVGVHVEMSLEEARAHAQSALDALAERRRAAIEALALCTTTVLSLERLASS